MSKYEHSISLLKREADKLRAKLEKGEITALYEESSKHYEAAREAQKRGDVKEMMAQLKKCEQVRVKERAYFSEANVAKRNAMRNKLYDLERAFVSLEYWDK